MHGKAGNLCKVKAIALCGEVVLKKRRSDMIR